MRKWLVYVLTAIGLSFVAWSGSSIIGDGQRLSTVEAQQRAMETWLNRVENKLDQVLDHRR